MRTVWAAALVGGLALPAAAQRPGGAGRYAYRAVERVSDGVYGLMRGTLFTSVLPRRLTRDMAAAPEQDSYAAFRAELSKHQLRASRRIVDARPQGVVASPASLAKWRTLARDEEQDALAGAFASTMVDRYKLEAFGESSGAYAKDRRNWEPGFLAPAAVLGGAYLWVAGVDAGWNAGPARVGLRVAPGWRWRAAGEARRLASVELSARDLPLSVRADWGGTGPEAEAVTVAWTQRF
jgi:hypothetical protein